MKNNQRFNNNNKENPILTLKIICKVINFIEI